MTAVIPGRRSRPGPAFLLAVVVALPIAVYAPLLDNGWFDDDLQYVLGARVQRLADLPRLATLDIHKAWAMHHYVYDAYGGSSNYRPMGYLYFALLFPLFGFHAPAYRLVNVLWYTLGTLLVLRLIRRLTQDRALAWGTAALMAVEVARFEFVAFLNFQGGLVLVLYLASVLAYLTARTAPEAASRRRAYLLSSLAAIGACFDYELAVSLPLVVLLVETWGGLLRRQWPCQPWRVLPHALLAGVYVGVRAVVESHFYPPERGRLMLQLTDPDDLFHAAVHMGSRVLTLFVPEFAALRRQVKVWLVGAPLEHLPLQAVLAARPLLAAALIGGVAVITAALLWVGTRPRLWRHLRHEPRGQMLVVAVGWGLLALTPTVVYNGVALRHLLIAAVGANLLKALVIVAVAEGIARRWAWDPRGLAGSLLVLVALVSVRFTLREVRVWEQQAQLNQTLRADAVRLIREAAVDDRPVLVYYLNGVAGGDVLFTGLQEMVQAAVGREDILVVTPYGVFPAREGLAEGFRRAPAVTLGCEAIHVANTAQPPQALSLPFFDDAAIRPGLTVRNDGLYTVTVLEADPQTRNLLRFTIRYARPPGTRVLLLMFDRGRLVPQPLSCEGAA